MNKLLIAILALLILASCGGSHGNTKVTKPRYHHVWAKGNRYRIDIPIGNRHIRFLERKRTKAVTMK